MTKPWAWLWNRAALLLVGATSLWAANAVASRFAVGQVSPMLLTNARWLLISVLLGVFVRPAIRLHAPALWAHKGLIFGLAATGLTGFNALTYLAAHYTTAVNMSLLQCLIPALVLAGSAARGGRVVAAQYIGVSITVAGVALVATRGHLADILLLRLNAGDAMILAGCFIGAWYNLTLARRPGIPALAFFAGLAFASFLSSLPLVAIEAAMGQLQWPTLAGWAIILFAAIGPALGAQMFFLRAVDLIGPDRAGAFNNLVPVFGSLFGVVLLGEDFAWYHAGGLVAVLAGIGLCEWGKRRR